MKLAPLLLMIAGFALGATAYGQQDGGSNTPYIDSLRRQMPQPEASPGSYTETEKKRIQAEGARKARQEPESGPADSDGYSEKMRRVLPSKEGQGGSYTEQEKAKLAPRQNDSAIAAVKEGRSELRMKREGDIHHATGFSLGAAVSHNITGDPGFEARSFSDVYGGKYIPYLTGFYEYQPFHSEWFGNVGLQLSGSVVYATGKGKFQFDLTPFPTDSKTDFTFTELPLTLGLIYRFNLLRVVRPYVFAGPSFIGYVESRSDHQKDKFGYSTGLKFSGGVNILLDFFSEESWDLYEQWNVKHYYLTIDYQKNTAISGGVNFASSGVTAGLTFEY